MTDALWIERSHEGSGPLSEACLERRRRLLGRLERGELTAGAVAALLADDAVRLARQARSERDAVVRRARWLHVKVRFGDRPWVLWIPMPLGLVHLVLSVAARTARFDDCGGDHDLGRVSLRSLMDLLSEMPACGKVVEAHVDGKRVEVWLT